MPAIRFTLPRKRAPSRPETNNLEQSHRKVGMYMTGRPQQRAQMPNTPTGDIVRIRPRAPYLRVVSLYAGSCPGARIARKGCDGLRRPGAPFKRG